MKDYHTRKEDDFSGIRGNYKATRESSDAPQKWTPIFGQ
jgi:hypothetical protein